MMRVPGRKIMRRALRPIRRRFFPGAVVLGYHRIADDPWDPLGLQVSSQHFAEQLQVLQGLRTVIPLEELAGHRAAGEPLDRYAVLTFDDGYLDFADTVVPMARQADVPVTAFVASGCTGRRFWWEEFVGLLSPEVRGGAVLEVRLDGAGSLRFEGMDEAEARRWAVNDIGARLSRAAPATIDAVLAQVREWVAPGSTPPTGGRPMTATELAVIARDHRVEIGAHTVSHCFLEGLDPGQQRAEIANSKAALEAICARPVRVFSYPNGSFSALTPDIVRELGFACACASMEGSFTRRGDPFMIPRVWVPDLPGPEFRRWLGNWVAEAAA
jgi:peptidoglycan/xylan/chitin deacetylase (PgdA/CDA1 family)